MLDNRIKAIKKSLLILLVLFAVAWTITEEYRNRIAAFRYHQELTVAYLLATGGGSDAYIHDEAMVLQSMEIQSLPKGDRVIDYIYKKKNFPFTYNLALPGPGEVSIEVRKETPTTSQIQCDFSLGPPLKQNGTIYLTRLSLGDKEDWSVGVSTGSINPNDWEPILQEVAFQLGISAADTRTSIMKTRLRWNEKAGALPILGISVYATQAVPLLFVLAIGTTCILANNARKTVGMDMATRSEPWLILDNGTGKEVSRTWLNNLLLRGQVILEFGGRCTYYLVGSFGALGIGVLCVLVVLDSPICNLWIGSICIGMLISFLSGILAAGSMIQVRRKIS